MDVERFLKPIAISEQYGLVHCTIGAASICVRNGSIVFRTVVRNVDPGTDSRPAVLCLRTEIYR